MALFTTLRRGLIQTFNLTRARKMMAQTILTGIIDPVADAEGRVALLLPSTLR